WWSASFWACLQGIWQTLGNCGTIQGCNQIPYKEERSMPVDVVMPQMGESIFEGTVTKWLRKPGESVRRDEPLFEISTDKVDAEIPSPATGVLKEIKVPAGQTVQVNTVVAILDS